MENRDEKPDFGMPVHPVCDLFPLLVGDEFEALGGDIRTNGLINPIVIHEGQIVDGRNRLLACRDVGVEPRYVEWRQIYKGPASLARWIWSTNGERRHITLDQLLAIEVAVKAWDEKEAARQRQHAAGEHGKEGGRGRAKTLVIDRSQGFFPLEEVNVEPAPPECPGGRVREKLAKDLGVSERKVQQALNVQDRAPDLLKQVARGTLTLLDADKQVKTVPAEKPTESHRPEKAKPRFQAARAVARVVRSVEKLLGRCPEAKRGAFLSELIKGLENLR